MRHDLLGEHVERRAGDARLLDGAVEHPLDDDRRLEQVAAVLGEDDAVGRLAHVVAGPADALQAGGDRWRRLDLDDQVDGPHVDPQLQAAGGDQRGQPTRLERLLDLEPLLARDAAMMGAHQLLPGELVQAAGQTLREPSRVDEDEGGPMAAGSARGAADGCAARSSAAPPGPPAGPPGCSSGSMGSPSRPCPRPGP